MLVPGTTRRDVVRTAEGWRIPGRPPGEGGFVLCPVHSLLLRRGDLYHLVYRVYSAVSTRTRECVCAVASECVRVRVRGTCVGETHISVGSATLPPDWLAHMSHRGRSSTGCPGGNSATVQTKAVRRARADRNEIPDREKRRRRSCRKYAARVSSRRKLISREKSV